MQGGKFRDSPGEGGLFDVLDLVGNDHFAKGLFDLVGLRVNWTAVEGDHKT